jgi:hypothetical protein
VIAGDAVVIVGFSKAVVVVVDSTVLRTTTEAVVAGAPVVAGDGTVPAPAAGPGSPHAATADKRQPARIARTAFDTLTTRSPRE